MASGNRPMTHDVLIRNFPRGLKHVVEDYQNDRCLPSFSRAVIELLERHPEIDKRVQRLYSEGVEHLEHPEQGGEVRQSSAERDDP